MTSRRPTSSPRRSPRHLAPATAIVWLAAAAAAQAPSPWVDLAVPGGTIAGGVTAAGRLVLYRNGTFLRVFSAVTGAWHAHTPGAGTTPVLTKDLLLVPENDRWTGFSAYRGVFEPVLVPVAGSALVHRDSVACVTHGASLHTFSAFTGTWHTRTIPSGWILQLGNRVALLRTPASAANLAASAFDAFTGQWHDLPPQPAGLHADHLAGGSVVVATLTQQFGFSPLRAGWVSSPVTTTFPFANAQLLAADGDLAPGLGSVFSGLTGSFAPSPYPPSVGSIVVAGNVAAASDGSQPYALGAAGNAWVPLPATPSAPWAVPGQVLSLAAGGWSAFSALHDTFDTATGTNPYPQGNVVTLVDGAQNPVFSALTGQWYSPPPGAAPGVTPAHDSAIYRTATGVAGFAAPSGAFVPLAGSGLSILAGFAAADGTTLHAFDARGRRWLSHPRQPGSVTVMGHLRVLLAVVPGQVLAFATRGRHLAAQALPEPIAEFTVREDVAVVRTATHLFAFTGLADTHLWQGDLEDAYAAGRGTTARVQARVPPGHLVVMGFGPPLPAPVPLPFGELWLDPAASVLLAFAPQPGEVRAVVPIAVPNAPALRGSLWLQQALTLAPGGAAWLGAPSMMLVQ